MKIRGNEDRKGGREWNKFKDGEYDERRKKNIVTRLCGN